MGNDRLLPQGLNRMADEMNVNGGFKTLSTRVWKPLYAIQTYLAASKNSNLAAFEYHPAEKKSKNSSVTILKNTPAANSLVVDLGLKIIEQEQLGADNVPDMIMLQFTVRTPHEKFFHCSRQKRKICI